ncbi:MAG: hypothetical protein EVA62_04010 [Halieaceae bacterium]|nr:MAG: hypothetical protein EVA62_04010 [Halieaceae bacterium]
MKAIRPLYIVRLPWLNALIPMCLLLGSILPTSVLAQEVTDINPTEEQTEANEAAATPPKLKPWLITPTLSADPKLGANVGGLVAYLKKLDAESTPSMTGLSVSYSDTDSMTGALFSQLYWKADTRRLSLLAAGAEINNEYDDFLGTGQTVETQDNVHTFGFRYLHRLRPGGWFAGIQGISTNYAVGADGILDSMLNQIGLSGFDAAGLGLVFQHDTMNNQRDPSGGHLHTLHNFAYRESLGGETSFDVGYADLRWYRSIERFSVDKSGRSPVIAIQLKGRFTADAPLSGYSSVNLPGYTMGNYLSRHYSHVLVDARIPLKGKLGLVAFGGVGCQFGEDIAGRDLSCGDATFPSVGVGVSYMLKAEASVLIRLEIAKGKSDNEALYLRFGHSF